MTKHTPGPWVANNCTVMEGIRSIAYTGAIADHNNLETFEQNCFEAVANAHLIAAAPEMLEALEQAREFLAEGSLLRNEIEALIRKAKGDL